MNLLKRWIVLGLAFGTLLGICGGITLGTDFFTVDLRPEEWQAFHKLEQNGRPFVQAASKAHNRPAWKRSRERRFELEFTAHAHPLAWMLPLAGPVELSLVDRRGASPVYETLDAHGAVVKLVLVEGKGGMERNGVVEPGPSGTTFAARVMRQFIALPLELADAAIHELIGPRDWNGRPHDVVLVTRAPSLDLDRSRNQYAVWFDRQTGRVTRVDSTIRSLGRAAQMRVDYTYPPKTERVQTPSVLTFVDVTWTEIPLFTIEVDTVELQ